MSLILSSAPHVRSKDNTQRLMLNVIIGLLPCVIAGIWYFGWRAALVVAGLEADGYTTVSGVHHIDRGYEGFVEKLASLGAKISREEVPDPEDDEG